MDLDITGLKKDIDNFIRTIKERYNFSLSLSKSLSKYIQKIPQVRPPYRTIAIYSTYVKIDIPCYPDDLYLILYGYSYDNKISVRTKLILRDDRVSKLELRKNLLERELAIELLRKKEQGEINFDVILFRTSINPSSLPYYVPKSAKNKLRNLLTLSKNTGTALVSFAYKPRSYFVYSMIYHKKERNNKPPIPDSVIVHTILKEGDYLYLGSAKHLLGMYYSYYRKGNPNILSEVPMYEDTRYYLYKNNGVHRVELYDSEFFDPASVLAYLYHRSVYGIPVCLYVLMKTFSKYKNLSVVLARRFTRELSN